MDLTSTILFSVLTGLLPPVIWLAYFLREDRLHPEPSYRILNTFIYGMLAVPFALAFQVFVNGLIPEANNIALLFKNNYLTAIVVLILWATVEEIVKYVAAYKGGISKKDNNEPIDPIIYLITAALGFAALENTLFAFGPFLDGQTATALITGNLRFIGATLLHVASSAIIGMFIAFSYYKKEAIKGKFLFYGLVLSIVLHTIFNSFIIRGENFTLIGFSAVWISIVLIIILFEKVKRIYKPFN